MLVLLQRIYAKKQKCLTGSPSQPAKHAIELMKVDKNQSMFESALRICCCHRKIID